MRMRHARVLSAAVLFGCGFSAWASTLRLDVQYNGSPAANLDSFTIKLVSPESSVPLGAWDGDFFGTFYQVWPGGDQGPVSTPCYGITGTDTHYFSAPLIGTVAEDNDLSGTDGQQGWGTYLKGGAFAVLGGTYSAWDLAQIVVPSGNQFQVVGDAANGLGEAFHFDAFLSRQTQSILGSSVPSTVGTTPAGPATNPPATTSNPPSTASSLPPKTSSWPKTYSELQKIQFPTLFQCPDSSFSQTFSRLNKPLFFPDGGGYLDPFSERPQEGWISYLDRNGLGVWRTAVAVPEPISILLLSLGGLYVTGRKR